MEPTKEEYELLKKEAAQVAEAMSRAMFDSGCTKRASLVAAIRVAAGVSAMSGVDLHRSIHMFMTFYKEAEQTFEKREKKGKP